MTNALEVENLGKRYVIRRQSQSDGLRHVIEAAVRAPFRWLGARRPEQPAQLEEFWAVKDVSFSVAHGEAVGIIGRNGAGKSTILKLLSRITEPTTGKIRYRGRMASLLEVGTGFHPELTGRENIFLNAAILGMRRSDVLKRFDEIVAFSEVERFLDTPVKRYSSGMYVRLAFGVAAHLEPDILLVDEVLAVGDAAFQQKCLGKMGSVVNEGRTILFVSHNMAAVSSLCTRAIMLVNGSLKLSSAPQEVIEAYLSQSRQDASTPFAERADRKGAGRIRFLRATLLNGRGEPADPVASGQDMAIALDYAARDAQTLHNAAVQVKVQGPLGEALFSCLTRAALREPLTLPPKGRIVCHLPRLPLRSGVYTYTIWCTVGGILEDYIASAGTINVAEGDFFGTGRFPARDTGAFLVDHRWSVESDSLGHPHGLAAVERLGISAR
jgi:lipopolysaccharide transport system ATP-binding protein